MSFTQCPLLTPDDHFHSYCPYLPNKSTITFYINLSQIMPPAMLALRHWVLDTNTKINYSQRWRNMHCPKPFTSHFTMLSQKQTRKNIIKLKPSMHFVLKVVISQHEIRWRRSGISHWSEMMMTALLLVSLIVFLEDVLQYGW